VSVFEKTAILVRKRAEDIIYDRLGTSIGAGNPRRELLEGNYIWRVPLESDYPRIVKDQKNNTLRYSLLHLGTVGEMLFDTDGEPIEVPHRVSIDFKINEELSKITDNIADLLLRTESGKYAKLVSTRHLASPLSNIITNVLTYDRYQLPDPDTRLGKRIMKYAQILKKRNHIFFVDKYTISPTPELQGLHDTRSDLEFTIERVLTDVIKNEGHFMSQIRLISPYIKVPTSYYDHALSAQSLITLSKEDLLNAYAQNYGFSARIQFRFADWLRVLINRDVQILEKTSQGYLGNESVFDTMSEQLFNDNSPMRMVI